MGENLLAHFAVAFIMPLAWAVILYPFCRKYHLGWIRTIIAVLGMSFLAMIAKEIFDDSISINDITADFVGLFLGTAALIAVKIWGGGQFAKLAIGLHKMKGDVSLRDFMNVGLKMQERAVSFFEEAAGRIEDEGTKEICRGLAEYEKEEAGMMRDTISEWSAKAPDREFVRLAEEEITQLELYTNPIFTTSTSEDVLRYSIKMKKITQDFYISYREYFPMDWKKDKVQELIRRASEREKELKKLLSRLRENNYL